ncbi:hypothetical protein ACEYW6_11930 [Nostoc sp. UIC 10607]|uniref:hypothetical protein n=1 Tax=Nostoc sp. UIC 10607 TaxID=3045935 RepID=UPI00399FFF70
MRLISYAQLCDRSSHSTLDITRRIFEANYTLCLIAIAIDLSVNYFVKRSHILIHKELYLTTNRGSVYTFVII